MEQPHYLLQNVLVWWQTNGFALASVTVNSFEKNVMANFWRDIGNLITGTGAGWAATRDSFFNLFGVNVPTQQPQSGDDAVRNTLGSFIQQIFQGDAGSADANTASGSSPETPGSSHTQPPLSDLLTDDLGGTPTQPTLADVVKAARGNSPQN